MDEKLYRYAVIQHPTSEERKAGARSVVVVPPSDYFLARYQLNL